MKHILFLLVAVALALLAGCSGDLDAGSTQGAATIPVTVQAAPTTAAETPAALMPIRLPMGYIPDPQYAPFYVADARGYFAAEGFEVEFDYSFETDGVALVGAGELPFAIVSGEQVLLARAQSLPIVYVLEWFERYPVAIISREEAGIEGPADLVGRTVGLPGFFGASYVGYAGLLSASGIDAEQVVASEIGFTQVEALLTDQVEAVVGYVNNEPLQLAAQGVAINVIEVADHTTLVANGIIANEQVAAESPETVTRFVRAILRGLADTLADPEAAFEIAKGYVEGLDDSRMSVLEASLNLWRADALGVSDAAAWQNTHDVLLEIGFLDAPLADLEAAYTNEFVIAAQQ